MTSCKKKLVTLLLFATQIRMVERLLETIEYAKVHKDSFAIHHQINTGVFNDINDVLQNIRVSVQKNIRRNMPGMRWKE